MHTVVVDLTAVCVVQTDDTTDDTTDDALHSVTEIQTDTDRYRQIQIAVLTEQHGYFLCLGEDR